TWIFMVLSFQRLTTAVLAVRSEHARGMSPARDRALSSGSTAGLQLDRPTVPAGPPGPLDRQTRCEVGGHLRNPVRNSRQRRPTVPAGVRHPLDLLNGCEVGGRLRNRGRVSRQRGPTEQLSISRRALLRPEAASGG